MSPKQKRRLLTVSFLVIGLGTGITLVLMALNENINLFFTPAQVVAGEVPPGSRFRVGGMVVPGSVEKAKNDITTRFKLAACPNKSNWSMRASCLICSARGRG